MRAPASLAARLTQIGLVLLLAALTACSEPSAPLPHQAYVWQRVWTPAVTDAVVRSAPAMSGWRVIAAELDGQGTWHEAGADRKVLAATGKPITLVFRIEGQLVRWDEARLRSAVLGVLSAWRAEGLKVTAIEIDHDCGTARLAAYRDFLRSLRAASPEDVRLSLTALPAWLGSPALPGVLGAADEAVLQVHAVSDPGQGLFDPGRARRWMAAFGKVAGKPWRVALPAYGSKVVWDERGRIAAVDSERPSLVAGQGAAELLAPPEDMAAFLAALDHDRPPYLAGIVWFRLPAEGDSRAWSLPTWLAVVRGEPLRPMLSARAEAAGQPGLYDISVRSDGTADAVLPALVRVEGNCTAADGINFFTAASERGGFVLTRTRDGLLPPGRARLVGWARCSAQPRLQVLAEAP